MKVKIKDRTDATEVARVREMYEKRMERIRAKRDRRLARDYLLGVFSQHTDVNYMLKPNHGARAQSIEDVFASKRSTKSKDRLKGVPMVGHLVKCPHSLVAWFEDTNERGRKVHFARTYPCTVDHGWTYPKNARGRTDLVQAQGMRGEHRDANGRRW